MLNRRYTLKRYVSTVDRHLLPLDAVGDGSFNMELAPKKGSMIRRRGQGILADAAPTSDVGLLESKWGARCRQILQIRSPSMDNGYPVPCALYTDETGYEGALWAYSTDGATNSYQLGEEFGTFHYTPDGAGTGTLHVVPLRSFDSTTKLTRLNTATHRKVINGKVRRGMIENGNWLFVQGDTPYMWNKRWNDSNASGSEVNRVRPWGLRIAPIMPNIPTASYPTAATSIKPWLEGETFFISVMFKFEDGSYSMPLIAREINTDLTAGRGAITIPSTTGSTDYYDFIPWRNIPIGPVGTVARILLRTEKQPASGATDRPVLSKFFICGVINDNVSTSYNDPLGNDDGLIDDPELVRFDHQLPWRAQCVASNDSRILIGGNLKPNPCGIYLAPSGVTASRDLNLSEDTASGLGSTHRFFVRLSGTSLELKWLDLGGPTVTTQTIDLSTGSPTLQNIVDRINATTTASAAKEWVAEVLPGTNPEQPATDLLVTTGFDTTATSPDDDDDYIQDASADATVGNMRAFIPALGVVLYLNDTWDARYTADTQEIRFTGASPGHPPSAPMNFYAGNTRKPPDKKDGRFVGAAPLGDKFIVCYENAIHLMRNIRGGTSGEDADFRLVPLNANRGCIAWDSIATGDGWVGYLTREGYVVTDGEHESVISGDVFDQQMQTGDWVYEVGECQKSVAAGTDSQRFHAMAVNGSLWVNYRDSSSELTPRRTMRYDYSANHRASGLEEVLDAGGKPFGWSPPHTRAAEDGLAVMGWWQGADGFMLLGASDANGGSAGDGRIDQFDTGNTDNGTAITSQLWGPTDLCDTVRLKQAAKFWWLYVKNGTGVNLVFYRDIGRAEAHTIALPTSSTALFKRLPVELPQGARANGEAFEWSLQDDASDSDRLEVFVGELDYVETTSEV